MGKENKAGIQFQETIAIPDILMQFKGKMYNL